MLFKLISSAGTGFAYIGKFKIKRNTDWRSSISQRNMKDLSLLRSFMTYNQPVQGLNLCCL